MGLIRYLQNQISKCNAFLCCSVLLNSLYFLEQFSWKKLADYAANFPTYRSPLLYSESLISSNFRYSCPPLYCKHQQNVNSKYENRARSIKFTDLDMCLVTRQFSIFLELGSNDCSLHKALSFVSSPVSHH